MTLEVGKTYLLRNGSKAYIGSFDPSRATYPFRGTTFLLDGSKISVEWTAGGRYKNFGDMHPRDIVGPAIEEPEPVSAASPRPETEAERYAREIQEGRFPAKSQQQTVALDDPAVLGGASARLPDTITPRDLFAAAALAGLLADGTPGTQTYENAAIEAGRFADAMMARRKS